MASDIVGKCHQEGFVGINAVFLFVMKPYLFPRTRTPLGRLYMVDKGVVFNAEFRLHRLIMLAKNFQVRRNICILPLIGLAKAFFFHFAYWEIHLGFCRGSLFCVKEAEVRGAALGAVSRSGTTALWMALCKANRLGLNCE